MSDPSKKASKGPSSRKDSILVIEGEDTTVPSSDPITIWKSNLTDLVQGICKNKPNTDISKLGNLISQVSSYETLCNVMQAITALALEQTTSNKFAKHQEDVFISAIHLAIKVALRNHHENTKNSTLLVQHKTNLHLTNLNDMFIGSNEGHKHVVPPLELIEDLFKWKTNHNSSENYHYSLMPIKNTAFRPSFTKLPAEGGNQEPKDEEEKQQQANKKRENEKRRNTYNFYISIELETFVEASYDYIKLHTESHMGQKTTKSRFNDCPDLLSEITTTLNTYFLSPFSGYEALLKQIEFQFSQIQIPNPKEKEDEEESSSEDEDESTEDATIAQKGKKGKEKSVGVSYPNFTTTVNNGVEKSVLTKWEFVPNTSTSSSSTLPSYENDIFTSIKNIYSFLFSALYDICVDEIINNIRNSIFQSMGNIDKSLKTNIGLILSNLVGALIGRDSKLIIPIKINTKGYKPTPITTSTFIILKNCDPVSLNLSKYTEKIPFAKGGSTQNEGKTLRDNIATMAGTFILQSKENKKWVRGKPTLRHLSLIDHPTIPRTKNNLPKLFSNALSKYFKLDAYLPIQGNHKQYTGTFMELKSLSVKEVLYFMYTPLYSTERIKENTIYASKKVRKLPMKEEAKKKTKTITKNQFYKLLTDFVKKQQQSQVPYFPNFEALIKKLPNIINFNNTIVQKHLEDLEKAKTLKMSTIPNTFTRTDTSTFIDSIIDASIFPDSAAYDAQANRVSESTSVSSEFIYKILEKFRPQLKEYIEYQTFKKFRSSVEKSKKMESSSLAVLQQTPNYLLYFGKTKKSVNDRYSNLYDSFMSLFSLFYPVERDADGVVIANNSHAIRGIVVHISNLSSLGSFDEQVLPVLRVILGRYSEKMRESFLEHVEILEKDKNDYYPLASIFTNCKGMDAGTYNRWEKDNGLEDDIDNWLKSDESISKFKNWIANAKDEFTI